MIINHLSVRNIRSIEDQSIPFRKINILVGDNSSGKSSVLYALLALNKMSLDSNSAKYAFHDFEWLKRRGAKSPMHIAVQGVVQTDSGNVDFDFNTRFNSLSSRFNTFCANKSGFCEVEIACDRNNLGSFGVRKTLTGEIRQRILKISESSPRIQYQGLYHRDGQVQQGFEGYNPLLHDWINYDYAVFAEATGAEFRSVREAFSKYIRELEFIPVSRGSFSVRSPQFDTRPTQISLGEKAPDEFLNMMIYPDFVGDETIGKIRRWAKVFGINDFEVVIQPGKSIEGRGWIGRRKEKLPMALYGFGTNQFMHMAAKCVFAHPNAPILVEEPEIHLHPEKQARATDFLIETMKEGHQLFITTHSEHIIGRIQRRIAELKGPYTLDSDDVSILWVRFDSKKKKTELEQVLLDEEGIFHDELLAYLGFYEEEMTATAKARRERKHDRG